MCVGNSFNNGWDRWQLTLKTCLITRFYNILWQVKLKTMKRYIYTHPYPHVQTDRYFLWNRRTKYLISYINSSWQSWALFSLTNGKIDGLCLNALSSKLIFYLCNRSFYWDDHLSNLTIHIIQYQTYQTYLVLTPFEKVEIWLNWDCIDKILYI